MTIPLQSLPWKDLLDAGRGEQLVAQSREGARRGDPVPLPDDRLHPAVASALRGSGVDQLWSHQAEALESSLDRGHTIVTTGTASGKSLAFNLPVLDVLARDRSARALYLYPTKALAQDQARKLHGLRAPFLRPAIYDGDTPREERRAIRGRSNLILTNPDMLNVSVLPHHRHWGDVLSNLAFVVVDEAHTYRGVFGSHVANVLRRLRRLANAYGTEPRFVLASATIANPVEL
ncbi:MAG: DEAD/DEAH box helicase, partial [Actinomycetota bacterium]|nr:DEAD/DEAH box helicase [Actinomycetota bacterium]